ncbi:CMGC/SRPK protein kinase [Apiospora phragmitis]|uniref:CMGC/SRPK protein kinase n=1 Tax=Apiospora phragmitis TaxID=2905665 RepID=A0ABR1UJW9_9PEZI
MSTHGPLYEHIEDVERLDYYRSGGYHTIQIGDIFQNRYLLDRYDIEEPNGRHSCLVTTPARCILADAVEAADYTPSKLCVARSLAAQLAMAVAHIHELGYFHGGEYLALALFAHRVTCGHIPNPRQIFIWETYSSCQTLTPIQPSSFMTIMDHQFRTLVKIILSDFGTAFCPSQESVCVSCTPLQVRPPEARFAPTEPLSYPSDIWSLGCMIWAVLGVRPVLNSWLFGWDDATMDQVDAVGPLPDEWWKSWEKGSKWFAGNGKPIEGRHVEAFKQRFEDAIQEPRRKMGTEVIGEEERDALFEMIRGMLVFSPGDRLSANRILQTEWMRKWAVPEAERTWGQAWSCSSRSVRGS